MKNIDEIKREYVEEKEHGIGNNIKDEYHTMSELYYNRMVLFSVICGLVNRKSDEEIFSWRSKLHDKEDGPMFDGFFIVGIRTPDGDYTYHYQLKYWDYFDNCITLENAPRYDGHEPKDIGRLYSLINK